MSMLTLREVSGRHSMASSEAFLCAPSGVWVLSHESRPGFIAANWAMSLSGARDQWMPVAARRCVTNVIWASKQIHGKRDSFEVGRVDAVANAAQMIDGQPIFERTFGVFVRPPVSVYESPSAIRPAANAELSIAGGISLGRPQPASIGFVDLGKESLIDRDHG